MRHLAERSRPLPLAGLLPGKAPPLAWGLHDGVEDGGAVERMQEIDQLGWKGRRDQPSPERMVLAWLAEAAGTVPCAGYALEALAWCHALPGLAKELPPDVWCALLGHLLGAAADACALRLDDAPLVHQMLAGELPLTLSYLLPEIAPCRRLAREARRALSAGLIDLLDGEGLPRAEHLRLLSPLLACWTRCRAMGNESSKRCWSERAQTQYEWLVRNALRLARPDGTHVFSNGRTGRWCEDLLRAALRLGGDETDAAIAFLVFPRNNKQDATWIRRQDLPAAATHSEWATVGVLHSGWGPDEARLVAAYPDQAVRVEFQSKGDLLWSGRWELEVRCDGGAIRPHSQWEEVCWVSNDDVDYLELELQLDGGLRVQRHMLLARKEHFLFLADAILGQRPARLDYCGCLPLVDRVSLRPAEETREGFLAGRRRLALVLPLALPEWRADPRVGSLVQTDRGLELRQHAQGRSMFAPLFFDLRPRRMARPVTWRHLTVAEKAQVRPNEVAVGYRVGIGKQQWLIYRSLARPGNRTLLGHNLTTEMLVARFERNGEVEPLVEIE